MLRRSVPLGLTLLYASACPGPQPDSPKPAPKVEPGPGKAGPGEEKPTPVPGSERVAGFKGQLPARKAGLDRAELFRKNLVRGFGFQDKVGACVAPPPLDAAAIDVHASLFVHDEATLGDANGPFSLKRTLEQLATQALPKVPGITAADMFRDLWDTQNEAPGAGGSHHCKDEASPIPGTDLGGINDYPVHCRPADGVQANAPIDHMAKYRPIALVNRLDLAHEGWRNCGEHRIVYGRTDSKPTTRNFIIFEAVLPNPKPGCRSACKPVMEFWAGLSTLAPAARQTALEKFYYKQDAIPGFRPVVHIDHYTAKGVGSTYGSSGSGQIRTNQFFQLPWLLKEFHVLLDCESAPCTFTIVPSMVKVNPFGELWDQGLAEASPPGPFGVRAAAFQADLLADPASTIARLASATFDGIGYPVDLEFDAAESDSLAGTRPDNYLEAFNASSATTGFHAEFTAAASAAGRTPQQLINRAIGLSCAGCHEPETFGLTAANAIGPATLVDGTTRDSWPSSAGFVHVAEEANAGSFPISPALTEVFLPSRKANLVARLQEETCQCEHKFPFLAEPARERAIAIQQGIAVRSKAVLEALRVPPGHGSFESLAVRQRKVAAAERGLENELRKLLTVEGIELPPVTVDVTPQPDRLGLSAADPARRRALQIEAVGRQLRSEPARRTVTGSFRVH